MFVSYTYDAGRTWHTVNATPNNPVQRGCISNGGIGRPTPCRNLLDFNDITVDNHGRVLVAYTDGCTTNGGYSCDKTNRVDTSGCVASEGSPVYSTPTCTYGRLSSVLRQTCGLGLLAKFDGDLPSCSGTTASNVLAKRFARAPTPLPATGLGSGDVAGGGLMLLALACIVARRRILPA
jgi:hypothetical protein